MLLKHYSGLLLWSSGFFPSSQIRARVAEMPEEGVGGVGVNLEGVKGGKGGVGGM